MIKMLPLTEEKNWNSEMIVRACTDTCQPDNAGYIEYNI